MSIVRNLTTFKMGSVVDLFEGVSIWLMLALVTTTLISMVVFYKVHSLVTRFWWTPLKLRKTMEQQGWKGPKFSIFVGNMPEIFKFRKGELSKDLGIRNFDIMSRVHPQYVLFSKKYGKSNIDPHKCKGLFGQSFFYFVFTSTYKKLSLTYFIGHELIIIFFLMYGISFHFILVFVLWASLPIQVHILKILCIS